MINAQPMQARQARARRCGATLAVLALVLSGCSTSGGKKLTAAELSKTMPTAQEVGAGFRSVKVDDSSNDSGFKVSKKCNSVLHGDDEKGKQRAKREFKDAPAREIDVSATTTDKDLGTVEKAAKICSRIPFTSGSATGIITLKLTPSKGIGDHADALDVTISITKPLSVSVKGHGIIAKRGNVGISVLGLDGLDDQLKITPIDNAMIDKLATSLDQKVKDAQG
ncbi:MAG: hypothetical protein M3Z46_08495 [Actinomycetota bacterium]|nr:hypothetical protein [Actinomycetota bacterium]